MFSSEVTLTHCCKIRFSKDIPEECQNITQLLSQESLGEGIIIFFNGETVDEMCEANETIHEITKAELEQEEDAGALEICELIFVGDLDIDERDQGEQVAKDTDSEQQRQHSNHEHPQMVVERCNVFLPSTI